LILLRIIAVQPGTFWWNIRYIGFYLPTSSIFQFLTGGVLFTFQTAQVSAMINEQSSKIRSSESAVRHRFRILNPQSRIQSSESSDAVEVL